MRWLLQGLAASGGRNAIGAGKHAAGNVQHAAGSASGIMTSVSHAAGWVSGVDAIRCLYCLCLLLNVGQMQKGMDMQASEAASDMASNVNSELAANVVSQTRSATGNLNSATALPGAHSVGPCFCSH